MNLEEKYQKLTDIEHILKRPGMYIGGIEEITNKEWVLEDDKIITKTITYSPGLYKLFDEAIVNAYDQSIRDKTLTIIKIDITEDKIVVYNNGIGIDVLIHPKEKIYIPELIFSHLRSSTSFASSNEFSTGGIHGYGIKLTAIFSKKFTVSVGDPINHKQFEQTYTNNLSKKTNANIKQYDKKEGFVKITFTPDFKRFGSDKFSQDILSLFYRRAYDIAALSKAKVYLNGKLLVTNSLNKYINLITEEQQIDFTCSHTNMFITRANTYKYLAFVNSIYTVEGGTHVDPLINSFISKLKEFIMNKYKTNIKSNYLKDLFLFVISTNIKDPSFSSQSKEKLVSKVPLCDIPSNFITKVFKKLELEPIILNYIQTIQSTQLKKTEKSSKKTVKGIKKLYDAAYAGTSKSHLCSLILTEGDSAKAMAMSGLAAVPNSNKIFGVFPLKGKLLNVREATHNQIMNNKEFINLKQIIGLQNGKVYKDTSELRYGSIILMMDADVDGSHIKGLFLNMMHYYWESLLTLDGFIKFFITPIVKVINGPTFYNLDDYNKWKATNNKKYEIKYYKGLGTNTGKEAQEYFKNLDKHLVTFKYQPDKSKDTFLLAFAKDRADDRKKWVSKYDSSITHTGKSITSEEFINKELIHFSNYDNIRSIPNLVDGFKPSQRKVLYSSFKKNITSDIKVAQLVGYISEHTSYHHGEMSLTNTIIGMCQNFVGANNINLLMPNGQFGTRLSGGKDHSSARYIYTQLSKITRYIFSSLDDDLLNYLEDDGFKIEPEYYIPLVPMILVNGCEGIGTGYRTFIPKYNIKEIINELMEKLKNPNYKFKELKPYYNGFKGTIMKEGNTYTVKGLYEKKDKNIIITELPINSWTDNYKEFLDNLGINYVNNCTDTTVNFTLKNIQDFDEKKYGLVKTINIDNMYLHNSKGIITKYDKVSQIMNEFYKIRLDMYDKRKKYLLNKLEVILLILNSKIKFIQLIISGKLTVIGKDKKEIITFLRKTKLYDNKDEFDYLLRMSFYNLTKEKIDELKKEKKDIEAEYNYIKNKTIEELWKIDLEKIEKLIT